MARLALLVTAFAALAAWAGAQGPPPPLSADVRANLFKSNRVLLENLVNHGVDLAEAGDPERRGAASLATASTLGNYLQRAAAEDQNADRVAELAELMTAVVRDGLIPNLEEGKRTATPGSPMAKKLAELEKKAASDLDAIRAAVPAGKVGDDPKVRAAMEGLAALKGKLGK